MPLLPASHNIWQNTQASCNSHYKCNKWPPKFGGCFFVCRLCLSMRCVRQLLLLKIRELFDNRALTAKRKLPQYSGHGIDFILQTYRPLNISIMKNMDVKIAVKWLLSSALISLLCACAIKPHTSADAQGQAARTTNSSPSADSGKNRVQDGVFKNQQVIKPNPGIEKGKLLISYSMKAVRSEDRYLVQLSLVFMNQQDRSVQIRPHVVLLNERGLPIDAYTKESFLKFAAKGGADVTRSLISDGNGSHGTAQERRDWAKSYWLKNKFTIFANGIEIGELVYHCPDLKLPMKLIVNAANQKYEFAITEPIAVLGEKKKDAGFFQ